MTLVYERKVDGPKTLAMIVGCGRFPSYRSDISRRATVAGARAVTKFLQDHADDFVARVAKIEVLLSDPAIPPGGGDRLGLDRSSHDPRGDDAIEPAQLFNAMEAARRWLADFAPGDHLFFYMSSHGLVDIALSAIGLLEDFYSNPDAPYTHSIDISALARGAIGKRAGASWIFLDACQEIVPELLQQPDGSGAAKFITPTLQGLANGSPCLALAGSRFGGSAWAPNDDKPPFFTQALLHAMGSSGVSQLPDLGWAVTGQRLLFDLKDVADAALDNPSLDPQPLQPFSSRVALLKVKEPQVPVVVRTATEGDMLKARSMRVLDSKDREVQTKADDRALAWRFNLPADGLRYRIESTFDGPAYGPHTFEADPAAQIISLAPIGGPPPVPPTPVSPPRSSRVLPSSDPQNSAGVDSEIELAGTGSRPSAPLFAIGMSSASPLEFGSKKWRAEMLPVSVKSVPGGLSLQFEDMPNWSERPLWRLTLSVAGDSALRMQLPLFTGGVSVDVVRVETAAGPDVRMFAHPINPHLATLVDNMDALLAGDFGRDTRTTLPESPLFDRPSRALLEDDPWTNAFLALIDARTGPMRRITVENVLDRANASRWLPDLSIVAAWLVAAEASDSASVEERCLALIRAARRPYFRTAARMALDMLSAIEAGSSDANMRKAAHREGNKWRRNARQNVDSGSIVVWELDGKALEQGRLDAGFATIVAGRVTSDGLELADRSSEEMFAQ
jgi:hypothetical protein